MVDERDEEKITDLYQNMATTNPPRNIDVDNDEDDMDEGDEHKSLTEREEEDLNLSDVQASTKILMPDYGNTTDNGLLVSRLAPDIFIPMMRLKTNARIKQRKKDESIDVTNYAVEEYTKCSIALDGKGRVDVITLAGANSEEEENLDEIGRGLGMA